jgi:hypothetical protein
MKYLFLITAVVVSLSVRAFADASHHVLWVSLGEEPNVLVPLGVAVDQHWSSINPASSPLAWVLNDPSGSRVQVNVRDTKQTLCGPVQLIDRNQGVADALAVNPSVRVSYFKPLPDDHPMIKALRNATKSKGRGQWVFQGTNLLLKDWTVYGYEERLHNPGETGTLYGVLVKHGDAPLQVYDVGEAFEGKRGTLVGEMIGLFAWENDIYLVETEETEETITTRFLVINDHLREIYKRECPAA